MPTLRDEISRKVLGAPSPGRLLRLYCTGDAPEDGDWERFKDFPRKLAIEREVMSLDQISQPFPRGFG